jgi:hypothetical protein
MESLPLILSLAMMVDAQSSAVSPPGLFARENLVAWCIVPFDAKRRTPEARVEMLKRLGFKKYAYDWRNEHLPTFEREIVALNKNGIELTAVWFPASLNADAKTILSALNKHNVKTQLWVTMGGGGAAKSADEQRRKVAEHARSIRLIANAAAEIGCTVALYNHGSWFGEPENQIEIIEALKLSNVGIVYNFHHGHNHLDRFPALLKKMQPYLVALNLNGMVKNGDAIGRKILPLGQGDLDLGLLKTIAASGYRGPIGILGHTNDDAEERLKDNLNGLDWLLPQLEGKAAGPRPKPRTPIASAPSVPPDPRGYVCFRAESPITIDGKLDEASWASAPWSEMFVDIEGDAKLKPRWRTHMKMLWDDRFLYIAAEMEEQHLWATLTQHDEVIFQDHDFEVFLDPDGDNQNYCELELNAKNTTWDLLLTKPYRDGGRAVNGWEIAGLKTAVRLDGTLNDPRDTDRGWTVEIAWPWTGLKELTSATVPPRDGDQWRINFSRVEWDMEIAGRKYQKVKGRPEHNWVWSPQGVIDMHRPERWGYLQFSTAKVGSVAFRPDPDRRVRDQLHRIYDAQREHCTKTGTYADSLEALKLNAGEFPKELRIERTWSTFEAQSPSTGDPRTRWVISQDSWIRNVGPSPPRNP